MITAEIGESLRAEELGPENLAGKRFNFTSRHAGCIQGADQAAGAGSSNEPWLEVPSFQRVQNSYVRHPTKAAAAEGKANGIAGGVLVHRHVRSVVGVNISLLHDRIVELTQWRKPKKGALMPWPEPITLRGTHAILEPLAPAHCNDLAEAVQDGELWKLWYTSVPEPAKTRAEIDRRIDLQSKGAMLPFAVIDAHTSKAVGMTSYWNVDA